MTEQTALAIMWSCVALAFCGLVFRVRDIVLEMRAARRLVRVIAEREEYRPMLERLFHISGMPDGSLELSEYEQVALRERVRQALVYLVPADRKRVERALYAPSVAEREGLLRGVLSASIWRLQHQG
jgi:hypothetical protein